MARRNPSAANPNEPVEFPGIVVIDTREQLAFSFSNLRTDADQGNRPLRVLTVRGTLDQGDYSLFGYERRIALERKSCADLFSTIGQGRNRFVRELERLADYEVAGVVVEADWNQILTEPPPHTELKPKIVYRSILAWSQQFPRVHWWMMPSRRLAEVTTFRLLQRFFRQQAMTLNPG